MLASLLKTFCASTDIPEVRNGVATTDFSELWKLCTQENAYPYLSTLVRFMKFLKSDDLERMLGARKDVNEAVVSTIHKVKGLEYDNVIIVPSQTGFGKGSRDIEADAAEEARLLYVAMTRAKSNLVYHVGKREYSWGQTPPQSINGIQRQDMILTGMPNQIFLGWPMLATKFHPNPESTQTYIETKVAVGDQLELDGHGGGAGRVLIHRDQSGKKRQVGFLATKFGAGGAHSRLKVSAVIRYTADKNDRVYAPCVKERGWGYVVLVEGTLR